MESDDNEYTIIIINDLYIEQRIYRGYTCHFINNPALSQL